MCGHRPVSYINHESCGETSIVGRPGPSHTDVLGSFGMTTHTCSYMYMLQLIFIFS